MYIMWTAQGQAFLFTGTLEAARDLARYVRHQYGLQITRIVPYSEHGG